VPLFLVQVFSTAVHLGVIFLLPDLLLSRQAPSFMVHGGGHFALIAGGCLCLLPAGHAADRFGARRVLILANIVMGAALGALLLRETATAVDLAIVAVLGGGTSTNNVVSVSEGNRRLPGRASGISALLMGFPWCFAAVAPMIVGLLADPSSGGTPARALAWLGLAIPASLLAGSCVGPVRPTGADA
jgi:MFS family permease